MKRFAERFTLAFFIVCIIAIGVGIFAIPIVMVYESDNCWWLCGMFLTIPAAVAFCYSLIDYTLDEYNDGFFDH